MIKGIVIGGGLAGLSASVYLSQKGIKVTLLEASPKLGGRTYSFLYNNRNTIVDNGQHIMMGCYNYTLDFLETIKAKDKIEFQNNLKVLFIEPGGKYSELNADKFIYPFNLLFGILKYSSIRFRDRLLITKLMMKLPLIDLKYLRNKTVKEWLIQEKQSELAIRKFWAIIAVGTLNSKLENASAEIFCRILKTIFFSGSKSTKIVLPKEGLSQVFSNNAEIFLEGNNSEIHCSEKVTGFSLENNLIESVQTNSDCYSDFDFVVSCIPEYRLKKILNYSSYESTFEYSPIVTIHLWLKDNPFRERFYGLVDSKIHWLFNNKSHISVLTSCAFDLVNIKNSELFEIICSELENYFPIFYTNLISDYKIIKEKRATFLPTVENCKERLNINTSLGNLYLAGDWTVKELPATIESAIKSGKIAANNVILDFIN
ncbi:MAG: hydroxysqualene dehydroxylase HpnE [Ignavibacteria bacterium]|jgi:squalene-associated FAD-dependent desaturase